MIYTVKGFGIVNKAKVNVFLELSHFFYDPSHVGNLISGSSAFSESSLNIWNFIVYTLLKAGLENFEIYLAGVWDECSLEVVWTFFGISLLWYWNENWPFSSSVATAEFSRFASILSAALSQNHLPIFEIAQLELEFLYQDYSYWQTLLFCT